MNDSILWKIEDNIGHLILNDLPSNKMSINFFNHLKYLVTAEIPHSSIKALVIYGNGRHFSSGADINDLLSIINRETKLKKNGEIKKYSQFLLKNNKSFLFFENLNIPVIAAVRGVCLGSALELVLFCHIRLAADNSLFGLPETSFNLMPGLGGAQKIFKYAGTSKALELTLKGSNFSADEALEWNIIDKIIPKNEIIEKALTLAKSIPENYIKEKAKLYIEKYL